MINEPGIYIGIGMVLSLLATETLGVTAGGIIVPGYIAMHMTLERSIMIVATFGISIITFLIIKKVMMLIPKVATIILKFSRFICMAIYPGTIIPPAVTPSVSVANKLRTIPIPI